MLLSSAEIILQGCVQPQDILSNHITLDEYRGLGQNVLEYKIQLTFRHMHGPSDTNVSPLGILSHTLLCGELVHAVL